MSIHIQLSPEAVQKLHAQRRNSTISSIVISLLTLGLMGLCLAIWLLPVFNRDEPEVFAISAPLSESDEVQPDKVVTRVTKPTAPSSHAAKVIASTTTSPVSIPTPDFEVSEPSMDFGEAVDLGEGWGSSEATGSEASFFNQKVRAERIVWVVDYSKSMKSEGREPLMRKELSKSISEVADGVMYQIIFFSGPAWIATDKVVGNDSKAVVTTEDEKEFKWTAKSLWEWKQQGALRSIPWQMSERTEIEKSVNAVRNLPLIGGTDWETPLEMAFNMDPPPQVVFFMTDGAMEQRNMSRLVRGLAAKAKSKNIVVNTVTLIEPKAEEAMSELAERTGGVFTVVEKGGKVRQVTK